MTKFRKHCPAIAEGSFKSAFPFTLAVVVIHFPRFHCSFPRERMSEALAALQRAEEWVSRLLPPKIERLNKSLMDDNLKYSLETLFRLVRSLHHSTIS